MRKRTTTGRLKSNNDQRQNTYPTRSSEYIWIIRIIISFTVYINLAKSVFAIHIRLTLPLHQYEANICITKVIRSQVIQISVYKEFAYFARLYFLYFTSFFSKTSEFHEFEECSFKLLICDRTHSSCVDYNLVHNARKFVCLVGSLLFFACHFEKCS